MRALLAILLTLSVFVCSFDASASKSEKEAKAKLIAVEPNASGGLAVFSDLGGISVRVTMNDSKDLEASVYKAFDVDAMRSGKLGAPDFVLGKLKTTDGSGELSVDKTQVKSLSSIVGSHIVLTDAESGDPIAYGSIRDSSD